MTYKDLYLDLIQRDLTPDENLRLLSAEENADATFDVVPYSEEWHRMVLAAYGE